MNLVGHFSHRRKYRTPPDHLETHLHAMKVVTILIPSFHARSPLGNGWDYDHHLVRTHAHTKKETVTFSESLS